MRNYFLVKIKYEKTAEEGKIVKISEVYLVDALSFTEAEARIIAEMQPFISGEFEVTNIARYMLAETFLGDGDRYFRVKVDFITIDEEKGTKKRTGVYVLVQADDVKSAEANLQAGMKGTMADYEVPSITETKIIDIFNYEA